jgi:predicted signal transduction protein with EAL and GGDEF domain
VCERRLHVTASIGISTYPEDGEDAETLIRNADMAMYRAKEHGHDNYQFFQKEMSRQAVERQSFGVHQVQRWASYQHFSLKRRAARLIQMSRQTPARFPINANGYNP